MSDPTVGELGFGGNVFNHLKCEHTPGGGSLQRLVRPPADSHEHASISASSKLWSTRVRPTSPASFPALTHQTVWGSASTDSYLLGSYRIATAPEPNSSRLTSFKSTCFDSPANNVGPWPASLGCTTNSYSSINPRSANASGSFTPPTKSPLPGSC